jgi:sulfide dehydrogenase [flavocytochrome c] flavoprotein chain
MTRMTRRQFLRGAGAGGAVLAVAGLPGCAMFRGETEVPRGRRVVVVGGGWGGATAAKYIRLADPTIEVILLEPRKKFVSCPFSNLVLSGARGIGSLTFGYGGLREYGVKVRHEAATAIEPDAKRVRIGEGALAYDRVIVAPGVDFQVEQVEGLGGAQDTVLHAWKAGSQTVELAKQLRAMPDGGVFVLTVPPVAYRCPPGPYERACQVAWYFKRAKPRAKVLVLDGNEDVVSKKALFTKAWNEEYRGIVEYRPNYVLTDVDVRTLTAKFETADDVKADVLNVIPPHRAGNIAAQAGVITANDRWCEVDFLSFESIKVKNIHVLGDAIQVAPLMPKSGHMANQHGKVAAAAVLAALNGQPVNPAPVLNNACYSFITDREVVHVASVHQYDREKKTLLTVPGSGGLSPAMNALEGEYAFAWAKNIWADALT